MNCSIDSAHWEWIEFFGRKISLTIASFPETKPLIKTMFSKSRDSIVLYFLDKKIRDDFFGILGRCNGEMENNVENTILINRLQAIGISIEIAKGCCRPRCFYLPSCPITTTMLDYPVSMLMTNILRPFSKSKAVERKNLSGNQVVYSETNYWRIDTPEKFVIIISLLPSELLKEEGERKFAQFKCSLLIDCLGANINPNIYHYQQIIYEKAA